MKIHQERDCRLPLPEGGGCGEGERSVQTPAACGDGSARTRVGRASPRAVTQIFNLPYRRFPTCSASPSCEGQPIFSLSWGEGRGEGGIYALIEHEKSSALNRQN